MPNKIHDFHTDTIRLIQAHAAPRCQHVKTNGLRCQSPAMKRRKFCFYHERARVVPDHLELPLLEDANAIQMAIQQVARHVALGTIDNKRAGLLLYALQTAALNLKNCDFEPALDDEIVLDAALDTLDQQLCYDPDSNENTLDSYDDDDDDNDEDDDSDDDSDKDDDSDDDDDDDESDDDSDDSDTEDDDDNSDHDHVAPAPSPAVSRTPSSALPSNDHDTRVPHPSSVLGSTGGTVNLSPMLSSDDTTDLRVPHPSSVLGSTGGTVNLSPTLSSDDTTDTRVPHPSSVLGSKGGTMNLSSMLSAYTEDDETDIPTSAAERKAYIRSALDLFDRERKTNPRLRP